MSDFETVVGLLASGARIRLNDDGSPELRTAMPQVAGPIWDALCRDGWLEPMANGGTWKLSDAGLLAYLRSTDEMGDGKLLPPLANAPSQTPAKPAR